MRTFFGEPALKASLLARMEQHIRLDELVQQETGANGRGCFIWCAAHTYDAMEFERQFQISAFVPKLAEYFFEAFDAERTKAVAVEVLEAIPVEVDASWVWPRFWHWLVADPVHGLLCLPLTADLVNILREVDALYSRWPHIDPAAAERAARAAERAARAAASAAESAAASAAASAAWAAQSAAWAAESAAASAARATQSAAWAAENIPIETLEAQYQAFLSILRGLEVPKLEGVLVVAQRETGKSYV